MTELHKMQIKKLRLAGYSYKKIGQELCLSVNTIKSYCRRNGLDSDMLNNLATCKQCGQPIAIKEKYKLRQFCSDRCRALNWNSHKSQRREKTIYQFVCEKCGASFESHGNKNRKYCSHDCYIAARFGKGRGGNE